MAELGDYDEEIVVHMAASSEKVVPVKGMEEFKKSLSIQMALVALMDKTGYDILQENGQRKYGGPPPNWKGPAPRIDCEVFVGNIPRDMYEDELVPFFVTAGTIYELRLMMEFSGDNRGYAFVMYTKREQAQLAIRTLNEYEVRPGKFIGVCPSLNNCRLFIGSIPKDKSRKEIMEEIKKLTEGLRDVTVYSSTSDSSKNRGYAFLEYETHKAAALARKDLIAIRNLWGHVPWVNWAKPDKHGKGANVQFVRAVHVRHLSLSTTEETLKREFERFKVGALVRVKKFSDHAFLHFGCHKDAVTAASIMNGATIDGNIVEVSLTKPIGEGAAKKSSGKGYQGSKTGGGPKESVKDRSSLQSLNLPPHFQCAVGPEKADKSVFPLFPGTPLYRTDVLLLRPDQIRSAVSLLDLYCCRQNLPPPHYQLFSMLGQDGTRLLVYKVVMPLTQSAFVPDKLCVRLDDAKELAAQHTMWNLDAAFMSDWTICPSAVQFDASPPALPH